MNRSTFLTAVTLSAGFASHSRAEPPARVEEPNSAAVSIDQFDQSIAALRQELETVRAIRLQTRPVLDATPTADDVRSTVQQRRQMQDLLERLATAKTKRAALPPESAKTQPATKLPAESPHRIAPALPIDAPLPSPHPTNDAFALGRAAFQLGDYEQAERQLRSATGSGENQWYAQFLLASSLRLQQKFPEAVAIYDEIIRKSGDSTLQESARWQVANMRWQQTLDEQRQRLR